MVQCNVCGPPSEGGCVPRASQRFANKEEAAFSSGSRFVRQQRGGQWRPARALNGVGFPVQRPLST